MGFNKGIEWQCDQAAWAELTAVECRQGPAAMDEWAEDASALCCVRWFLTQRAFGS